MADLGRPTTYTPELALKICSRITANSVAIPTDSQIRERASRVGVMPGTRNNYANLKSQCGWKLAELINDHKMRVSAEGHRETIIEEVSATLKEKDADQETPLRLIPKGRSERGVGTFAG